MSKEQTGDISELKFDDKNFNKHTEFGMGTLEKSLREYGAGRSILVDKDNNIIAGNGIAEVAGQLGITKTRIVETTGDELVVVKRTDVELDSAQGRGMALADNATAAADLEWNEGLVAAEADKFDLDLAGFGLDFAVKKSIKDEKNIDENPPRIVTSFVTFDYTDEIELAIKDETATKLMDELIKYRNENGTYEGFWDERLKDGE
jgi:hypothetical protein